MRLLRLEYQKLKPYWPFWLLGGLYILIMLGLALSSKSLLDWLASEGGNAGNIPFSQMPIFDFTDIWQNLGWVGRFAFPLLGFLIVISVYNEINFRTLKQNIIDGLSRREWVLSKILLLLAIGVVAGIVQLLAGLYMGYMHSAVTDWEYAVENLAFVPAFVLQVVAFLSLAMLLTVWLRKSILSFGILMILYFPAELILRNLLPESTEALHAYFPIKGLVDVIHFPFGKYILKETQDYITFKEVAILTTQMVIYWILTFWIVKKRDL